jgi:hypothetical protein
MGGGVRPKQCYYSGDVSSLGAKIISLGVDPGIGSMDVGVVRVLLSSTSK